MCPSLGNKGKEFTSITIPVSPEFSSLKEYSLGKLSSYFGVVFY